MIIPATRLDEQLASEEPIVMTFARCSRSISPYAQQCHVAERTFQTIILQQQLSDLRV
jgi:hypothetical protein